MTDKSIELLIEVPAETKLAIERAAAARTLSVAAFLEVSLRKYLADAGYIDEDAADRGIHGTRRISLLPPSNQISVPSSEPRIAIYVRPHLALAPITGAG